MKSKPALSIIILNYNNPDDTLECVHSLMKNRYDSYEVILVDNGSNKGSVEILRQLESEYPDLILVFNQKNLGFAGGNNIGFNLSKGDMILLLNNDTTVKEDFLEALMKQASLYPEAGILCPKIYFHDRPGTIWFAGGYIDWKYDGAHIGYGKMDNSSYGIPHACDYVTGCAMLIKRNVIEKIGFLDESFFAYQEDVDFCIRARKAGYKCMYIPYPHVWHKAGSTSKKK